LALFPSAEVHDCSVGIVEAKELVSFNMRNFYQQILSCRDSRNGFITVDNVDGVTE
jgi:hypothetical protein